MFSSIKFVYTKLPQILIKEKLKDLTDHIFNKGNSLYLVYNENHSFFITEQHERYTLWSCQKKCDTLHFLLDNIFMKYGLKLYRRIVGIPMGTNCAPLVADLFLFVMR